jgi:hypothetical protein
MEEPVNDNNYFSNFKLFGFIETGKITNEKRKGDGGNGGNYVKTNTNQRSNFMLTEDLQSQTLSWLFLS